MDAAAQPSETLNRNAGEAAAAAERYLQAQTTRCDCKHHADQSAVFQWLWVIVLQVAIEKFRAEPGVSPVDTPGALERLRDQAQSAWSYFLVSRRAAFSLLGPRGTQSTTSISCHGAYLVRLMIFELQILVTKMVGAAVQMPFHAIVEAGLHLYIRSYGGAAKAWAIHLPKCWATLTVVCPLQLAAHVFAWPFVAQLCLQDAVAQAAVARAVPLGAGQLERRARIAWRCVLGLTPVPLQWLARWSGLQRGVARCLWRLYLWAWGLPWRVLGWLKWALGTRQPAPRSPDLPPEARHAFQEPTSARRGGEGTPLRSTGAVAGML
ncbi:hypothetical protein MNEG_0744 [Monoraphidium neglectum]|uniref:Uncharacterized protein n=1 Tax=Monoraphidium neglectum TaxID=145388 RepID=A0A0D2N4K6_9CHLO|nr:hypothetical protein MNEG_0744 [Monoraphidium neglectum]KIZ07212.1 hypothetical protein MNEG_0744 [Monoraphidium neglectum]|eukprot:XP_013906231.1 hypothetical protein MNEG_0744 [Monoraphidium neglectum]